MGDVALDGGEAGHTLLDIAQRDGAFAHIVDGAGYVVATRAYALSADFGELGWEGWHVDPLGNWTHDIVIITVHNTNILSREQKERLGLHFSSAQLK